MQDGIFAQIAVTLGGTAENYLANPAYFRTVYVLSDIWQKIGWDSIIYWQPFRPLIRNSMKRRVWDGANRFQQMLHITLPVWFLLS